MIQNYSVIEPAKIRTLLVPIGRWKRQDFLEKVTQYQKRCEARLVDITPLEDAAFNPQGFPQGRIIFDFHTSFLSEEQMLFLHDFEPYRKTFVIVGLANTLDQTPSEALETLQKEYPDSISHNIIYFNIVVPESKNIYCSSTSNIETNVCDIGRNFLEALSLYYSSYKHVTLRSPGAVGGSAVSKTTLMRQPATASAATASRVAPIDPNSNPSIKRSGSLKALGLSTASSDQQRAKARQCKILGNFQLLAGRYLDALNNFGDAATTLHKYHDYIWLGSALEGVIICMVLLSELKVSFHIPPIVSALCPLKEFEQPTQSSSVPRNSTSSAQFQSPRNSMSSVSSRVPIVEAQSVVMPPLIKSISDKILHYYEMSLSHNTEYAPQVVYCEHILRILSFMTDSHYPRLVTEGQKSIEATTFSALSSPGGEKDDVFEACFSKGQICQFANKLFELQLKEMDLISQIKIYTSLACIYRNIGFHRKQCFVSRILLVSLLSQNISESVFNHWQETQDEMLNTILEAYGIYRQPEALIEDAANCSWVTIQKNILLLCITTASMHHNEKTVCELSLLLLRKYSHTLTQSEQNSLLKRNVLPLMHKFKIAGYWDPFLLRDLQIMQLERKEVPQEKYIGLEKPDKNTRPESEVFNPFKQCVVNGVTEKSRTNSEAQRFLLGETAELILTFQNPFAFDLDITHISFSPQDQEFVQFLGNSGVEELPFKIRAGAMRSLHLPVSFIKETKGVLHKISNFEIGVFGLEPSSYDIVKSENSKKITTQFGASRANLNTMEFQVIAEQPQIEFMSSTLNENTSMILDGTKKHFKFTLRNKSLSQPANYLHFAHVTNVETSLKADYWKNLAADDLYDSEIQLAWIQNNCIKLQDIPESIEPNTSVDVLVELDVTRAPFEFSRFEILLEYGYKSSEQETSIFVRKLRIPFDVTLKRSLEALNLEVIPLTEDFLGEQDSMIYNESFRKAIAKDKSKATDVVLLLLDIRNSWFENAKLQIKCGEFTGEEEVIGSFNTKRFVIPIKKFSGTLDWGHKEIPKLVHGRQFVTSGLDRDQIITMCRKFWCREAVLQSLECQWSFEDFSSTKGVMDFRQFLDKFDDRTVDILYEQKDSPFSIEISTSKSEVSIGETLRIHTKLTQNNLHHNASGDTYQLDFLLYNRRTGKPLPKSNTSVLYNGQLSRRICPKHEPEVTLDLMPIDKGEYEIACCLNGTFSDVPVYFRIV